MRGRTIFIGKMGEGGKELQWLDGIGLVVIHVIWSQVGWREVVVRPIWSYGVRPWQSGFIRRPLAHPAWIRAIVQQRIGPSGPCTQRRWAGTGFRGGRRSSVVLPAKMGILVQWNISKWIKTHQARHLHLSSGSRLDNAVDGVDTVVIIVGWFDFEGIADLNLNGERLRNGNEKK